MSSRNGRRCSSTWWRRRRATTSFLSTSASSTSSPTRTSRVALSRRYSMLHNDEQCLVCLQLCSQPNTPQIQYLYLRYYSAIHNISLALCRHLLHPPGKGRGVLPARGGDGAVRRRVHSARGAGAALRRHLAESRVQTVVSSRSFLHRSVEQACERHPEWKSSLRVELLCGYLSNPLCIDQSADLFEECLAGTTGRRLSERTRRRTLHDRSRLARPRSVSSPSRRSSSRVCSSSARTSTRTTATRPARSSSFPSSLP